MNFLSTKDVLEFALSKERASARFYQGLGAQMAESTTRALFDVLLKNEQEHIEAILLEIEKLGYTVNHEPDEASSPAYEWQEHLETDGEPAEMTFADALVLAIQKERAAFRLYAQLLGQNQSPENETILMQLAEEEMRHVLQLEREYESLKRHRNP